MSSGVSPACLIAAVPASIAEASRWSRRPPATRRSRMPVRSTIHSSLVSTRCSRSALVSRCSGTRGAPARVIARPASAQCDPQPGDGLALAQPLAGVGEHADEAPGTGCDTGVDVPGPSTMPTVWPRVDDGPPSRRASSGRNTPTDGATIMRSGTSRPSPWSSSASIRRTSSEIGGDRRGSRCRGTGTSGTVRLARPASIEPWPTSRNVVGAERRPASPSTSRQRTGTATCSARRVAPAVARRRRRPRRGSRRPARVGCRERERRELGGERRRRRRASAACGTRHRR